MDHYNKIVDILEKPYIRNLGYIGVTEDHYNNIFSIIFKGKIKVEIIDEDYYIYNDKGNLIYYERSEGVWELRKFDNHLLRYYENSYGRIFTYEYGIVVKN
jgi:hypothetical protein